jgi:hypothetical protein
MCGYAEKLIEYSPRCIPGVGPRALAFKPIAARAMKLGVNISGNRRNSSGKTQNIVTPYVAAIAAALRNGRIQSSSRNFSRIRHPQDNKPF